MNERIYKIAQKTDAWCDKYYRGEDSYRVEWETKFADLIIRECAELSAGYTGNVKLLIMNHFGIEP